MKILVISLAGIGDTLMAMPLIHELRANFPGATIDVFVMWPGAGQVLRGNPHVNTVFQKNLIKTSKVESVKFLLELRKQNYDVSINTYPQSRVHYRMVARLINARKRISHEYDHASLLDGFLVNLSAPQNYTNHCIENNLALLPLIGGKELLSAHDYEIYLTDAERAWADGWLKQSGSKIANCRKIGFHIGSGGTKNLALRRWPVANYQALIAKLIGSHKDIAIMLFGGPEEEKANAQILAEAKNDRVMVPHTADIRQTAALLERCDIFLSVDTALMHLAAAVKVPQQFVIETPTLNATVVPYGRRFHIIKNPVVAGKNLDYYRYDGGDIRGTSEELLRCMSSVTVDEVYAAIASVLDQDPFNK